MRLGDRISQAGTEPRIVFHPREGAGESNIPLEVNTMGDTTNTTEHRVTITIESAELPVDEEARNAVLTEFSTRVGHLLDGLRGIDADQGDVRYRTSNTLE